MEKHIKLIKELTDLHAPSGFEEEARDYIKENLKDHAKICYDNLGSIICKKIGSDDSVKIMLPGHMDEIGFLVNNITKDGFIKFVTLGGWWDQVLLAQRVVIKTKNGDVFGVIGSTPPHLLEAKDRDNIVRIKSMFIDIGAKDRKEAEEIFGVQLGDCIVPDSHFQQMSNPDFFMAKALDNRLGVGLFMDIIKNLHNLDHPNTVYGVGTVQEEVGLRGASTAACKIRPDINFTVDVGIPGDTPGLESHNIDVKLGDGPILLLSDASLIPHRKLRDFVMETAKELDLPLQLSTMSGGGTDAGSIHLIEDGVPSVSFGVPVRYIHSHTSIFNIQDYLNLRELLLALIKKLDRKTLDNLRTF